MIALQICEYFAELSRRSLHRLCCRSALKAVLITFGKSTWGADSLPTDTSHINHNSEHTFMASSAPRKRLCVPGKTCFAAIFVILFLRCVHKWNDEESLIKILVTKPAQLICTPNTSKKVKLARLVGLFTAIWVCFQPSFFLKKNCDIRKDKIETVARKRKDIFVAHGFALSLSSQRTEEASSFEKIKGLCTRCGPQYYSLSWYPFQSVEGFRRTSNFLDVTNKFLREDMVYEGILLEKNCPVFCKWTLESQDSDPMSCVNFSKPSFIFIARRDVGLKPISYCHCKKVNLTSRGIILVETYQVQR